MAKFSLTILGIITLQLIFGTPSRPDNYHLSKDQETRLKDIAKQWIKGINSEKNPCEDFYDFVCSNEHFPNIKFNEFILMDKYNDVGKKLKNILNTKPELITNTEDKYFKYSTCGRFTMEEKKAFIKTFKIEAIGSWPAFVEKWDDSKFNLPLAIAEMDSYDYPVIFTLEFISDSKNNFKPTLQIKNQYLLNIENNKQILKTKFEEFGVKNPEEVLSDAELFIRTFKEAAQSVTSDTDKRITFSELKDYLPEIDWNKQIEIIYERKLPDDYSVLLKSQKSLKKVYRSIANLSPKVIANYFFSVLVDKLYDIFYPDEYALFTPVIKQVLMKHVYNENTKEMLKGMFITILRILQDNNILRNLHNHYSAEEIANFPSEEIFGLSNEEELEKEFKDVSTNNNDCINNYHRLQKIYKKISGRIFYNEIILHVNSILPFIGEPSFIFMRALFMDTGIFTTWEDFLEKENKEVMFAQLILKSFVEWTKNYPDFVQEENKILQEYDLSAEKLLTILIVKNTCGQHTSAPITGFANSVEFSQIYDCPLGSTMNPSEKFSFF